MTILSIQFLQLGVVPAANPNNSIPGATQTPSLVFIATNDTNATVTTAGYLNALQQSTTENAVFSNTQMALVYTTDDGVNFYQISINTLTGVITLVADVSPGDVLLPVIDHHIASFNGTTGQIADLTGTLIAKGSLQAGTATSQGSLISFGAANAGANDKLTISYVTSAGNRGLTITNAAMGQATTITMPDPGAAAANYLLTQSGGTQTIGTGALAISSGILSVGSVGHAGTLGLVPTTAANGQFILSATNTGAGNFNATLTNAAMGQSTTYTIPDPGAAAAQFILNGSAGTQTITTGSLTVSNGSIAAGNAATPTAGTITSFPAASGGANDKLVLAAVTTGGNFTTTLSNGAMGQSSAITIPDPGAATANFLLDAGAGNSVTDCAKIIPISQFMLASGGGAFVLTRLAQGNWVQLHTAAADTSTYGFDISEYTRAAASHGFELTSFDLIYFIGTDVLVAHTTALINSTYVNNVAVAVTTPAITGVLATATQANPYVTNVSVNVPAFINPAAGASVKQSIEVTVQTNATTVYRVHGINLRFTRTIK